MYATTPTNSNNVELAGARQASETDHVALQAAGPSATPLEAPTEESEGVSVACSLATDLEPRDSELSHSVMVQDPNEYRADVDGLRAVAVAAVVVYHMDNTWLPGGFIGVDIFFVISGYVVTGSLLRHQSPSLGTLLTSFYSRRVKRLAPALLLMTLTISIAMKIMLDPGTTVHLDYYYRTAQFALIGSSNIMFSLQSTSYFDIDGNVLKTEYNPFTHTWSLAAEEQFYFIFPTIFAIAYGRRATRRLPHCLQWAELGPTASPLLLLAGSAYVSLLFCAYTSLSDGTPTMAFYLLPSRFWQMMIGALLHNIFTKTFTILN